MKSLWACVIAAVFVFFGCSAAADVEISPYFFDQEDKSALYQARYETTTDAHEEKQTVIQVQKIGVYDQGILYELTVEDITNAKTAVPLLGCFFVTPKEIWKVDRDMQEEGTLVAADQGVPDPLPREEKGFHISLVTEEETCTYTAYNDATETGFYEVYVWQKGEGLVAYRSGYGAAREMFELVKVQQDF